MVKCSDKCAGAIVGTIARERRAFYVAEDDRSNLRLFFTSANHCGSEPARESAASVAGDGD
ncbi:hypothetical protein BR1R3_21620 [Pseudomonas atacamensis]|nr:hypothetical protein BR1R3_21620 [Pseudomonas atacamensis]